MMMMMHMLNGWLFTAYYNNNNNLECNMGTRYALHVQCTHVRVHADDAFLLPNVDYDFDLPFLRCQRRYYNIYVVYCSFNFIFGRYCGLCLSASEISSRDLCAFVTSNFGFIKWFFCRSSSYRTPDTSDKWSEQQQFIGKMQSFSKWLYDIHMPANGQMSRYVKPQKTSQKCGHRILGICQIYFGS